MHAVQYRLLILIFCCGYFFFFFNAGRFFVVSFQLQIFLCGKDENNINIEINNFIKGMPDSAQSVLICHLDDGFFFFFVKRSRKLWRIFFVVFSRVQMVQILQSKVSL